MTKLVLLQDPSIKFGDYPYMISVLENGQELVIKTIDNIGLDYWELTSQDQGSHIWTIDRPAFWADRPDIPNKAGIFGLAGWNPAGIIRGVGYTSAYITDTLQKNSYEYGQNVGPYGDLFYWLDRETNWSTVGLVFLRRHNSVETTEDLVVFRVGADVHVQTNLEQQVLPYEQWPTLVCRTIPFTILLDSPPTVSDSTNLTFHVISDADPLPEEWSTFYVKTDKGSTPMTIQLNGHTGVIPFDGSTMATGEVATLRIGLDFTARYETVQVTKG